MYQVFLAFWFLGSFWSPESFIWRGTIVDSATGKPISGVHVLSHNRQGISDDQGRFEIEVKMGDKVTFTHVGYEPLTMIVEPEMPSRVELDWAETEMEEFTLHDMPSEEQLKQLILSTPYVPSQLESSLGSNLGYMKNIYRLGNHHNQNSIDQVIQKFRSGNGEATFLSSNPSMGIIGLIRSLQRRGAIPKENPGSYHYPLDFKKLRKSGNDSTLRYSDYFE